MKDKLKKYNPEFKSIICNNIKVYRKEKGMRLMDLAEQLDVTPEDLKRVESANDTKKNCSLALLYKISIILDKKLDDFLIDNRNS